MAVSLKHAFTSAVPDGGDTSLVQPSNWNAEHTLTAGANTLLGAVTAGAVGEITCTAAGRALIDDADAAAQRTTLGLGTIATQASSNVSITGGSITNITDLAVADGGTGASTAANARANLAAAGTSDANTFTASQIIEVTDNTNAALRITQLGTGLAIRVEDSANPDATPFVVNADGKVVIGTATSRSIFGAERIFQIEGTDATTANMSIIRNSNNATQPQIIFGKTRGTTTGGTTAVQSGDGVGGIAFLGYDGTNFIETGGIVSYVDGTPGTNDMPGRIIFTTTADGAASPTERFRISSTGAFGIAGANYGTSGQTLVSGGSGAAPAWGTLGVSGGGTGATTLTGYVKGSGTSALTASATIPNTDITGLGTMSTQAASSVAITGGSITGITDLAVADGGTGLSSATAYALLAGGTTSTGAFQSLGTGTARQVLSSNGSSALPSWVQAGAVYIAGGIVTSSASLSFTNISTYSKLLLITSHSTTSNNARTLNVALSSNNGTSYGTANAFTVNAISTTSVAAQTIAEISNTGSSGTSKTITGYSSGMNNNAATVTATDAVTTGVINAIQITCSNTATSGFVALWGIP